MPGHPRKPSDPDSGETRSSDYHPAQKWIGQMLVADFYSEGCGFESCWDHQQIQPVNAIL